MSRIRLHDLDFELFIPEAEVNAAVDRLAGELRTKYNGKRPLFVGVLNGAFFFAAELMKRLDHRVRDHLREGGQLPRYQQQRHVTDLIGLNERIEGRHVVVVEDIVDTGNTMKHILEALRDHHPASVRIATLLFKPDAYKQTIPHRPCGPAHPNAFVVGIRPRSRWAGAQPAGHLPHHIPRKP
jgi:hypoxanthine phosphoribosyltransferase